MRSASACSSLVVIDDESEAEMPPREWDRAAFPATAVFLAMTLVKKLRTPEAELPAMTCLLCGTAFGTTRHPGTL